MMLRIHISSCNGQKRGPAPYRHTAAAAGARCYARPVCTCPQRCGSAVAAAAAGVVAPHPQPQQPTQSAGRWCSRHVAHAVTVGRASNTQSHTPPQLQPALQPKQQQEGAASPRETPASAHTNGSCWVLNPQPTADQLRAAKQLTAWFRSAATWQRLSVQLAEGSATCGLTPTHIAAALNTLARIRQQHQQQQQQDKAQQKPSKPSAAAQRRKRAAQAQADQQQQEEEQQAAEGVGVSDEEELLEQLLAAAQLMWGAMSPADVSGVLVALAHLGATLDTTPTPTTDPASSSSSDGSSSSIQDPLEGAAAASKGAAGGTSVIGQQQAAPPESSPTHPQGQELAPLGRGLSRDLVLATLAAAHPTAATGQPGQNDHRSSSPGQVAGQDDTAGGTTPSQPPSAAVGVGSAPSIGRTQTAHRLGSAVSSTEQQQQQQQQQQTPPAGAPQWDARRLVACCWALAHCCVPPPPPAWRQQQLERLVPALPPANPQLLTMLLWALGSWGHRPTPQQAAALVRATQQVLPSATPHALAVMLWGFCRMGCRLPPTWLAAWRTALQAALTGANGHDLSIGLWGLVVQEDTPGAAWLSQLLQHLVQQLRGRHRGHRRECPVTAQELTRVWWCLGRLRYRPDAATTTALLTAVVDRLDQVSPQGLALTVLAVAQLQLRPPRAWLSTMLAAAYDLLPFFTFAEASALLAAACQLGEVPPGGWMKGWWWETRRMLPEADTQALANALLAAVTLGQAPPGPWLRAWRGAALPLLGAGAFTPQAAAMVMRAWGLLEVHPGEAFMEALWGNMAGPAALQEERSREVLLQGAAGPSSTPAAAGTEGSAGILPSATRRASAATEPRVLTAAAAAAVGLPRGVLLPPLQLDPYTLEHLLVGCAKVGAAPPEAWWAAAVYNPGPALLRRCNLLNLSGLVWAAAVLGQVPPDSWWGQFEPVYGRHMSRLLQQLRGAPLGSTEVQLITLDDKVEESSRPAASWQTSTAPAGVLGPQEAQLADTTTAATPLERPTRPKQQQQQQQQQQQAVKDAAAVLGMRGRLEVLRGLWGLAQLRPALAARWRGVEGALQADMQHLA